MHRKEIGSSYLNLNTRKSKSECHHHETLVSLEPYRLSYFPSETEQVYTFEKLPHHTILLTSLLQILNEQLAQGTGLLAPDYTDIL